MADILIQPAVPSLFTHAESASSLIVDSTNTDSSNNSTTHTSTTNHQNNTINNNNNNNSNKYIGHVSRLRSVFTQYALTVNDLKSGEHRSRYSNHHQNGGFASPTRGIADGADESSLSPPTLTLPLVTTSSSTIIERSRSLSNPRLLENNSSTISTMRNGMSSLTMTDNQPSSSGQALINNPTSNDDHTVRFRKAKEMFQILEEEATRTSLVPSTKPSKSNETYQPDFMHDEQKILITKVNPEHIPDLIIDHHQQQQQTMEHSGHLREISIQYLGGSGGASASSSPTHSDRSFTSIPVHRTPPQPPPAPLISDEEVPYAMINRKHVSNDQQQQQQHYDFPADDIEQMKKQQRDDQELTHHVSKPTNEEIADRIVASILPTNILKRMDHLNTVFIKPANIDRSTPKLSFQENEIEKPNSTDDDNHHQQQVESETSEKIIEDEPKWIENPMANGK